MPSVISITQREEHQGLEYNEKRGVKSGTELAQTRPWTQTTAESGGDQMLLEARSLGSMQPEHAKAVFHKVAFRWLE